MDFYNELNEMGLSNILHRVPYEPIHFINQGIVNMYLDEMINNDHAKVFVYGDYDVDGAMFTMTTLSFLKKLELHPEVFRYRKRTHDLDKEAVRYCIQNKFTHFIIGDTASSDMSTLKMLVSYGIKVLVIDHHMTMYDYDDFRDAGIIIINSAVENAELGKERYCLCAGALSFCVFDSFLRETGKEPLEEEAAFALVSLYADCMDMSNIINRSIYYKATELPKISLPKNILHFMNEYQSLNARFIGYWFAPRINSLFRSEHFDVLNRYLFDDISSAERIHLIEEIDDIYSKDRAMVGMLSDLVDIEQMQHFVLCNLQTAADKHPKYFANLPNYTGLVANKLAERFGKTAVVYCEAQNEYKGSVRDPYSRVYLPLFQQICYAGGHGPAFGLKIKLFELNTFLKKLETIDQYFHITDVENKPIIIPHEYAVPDDGLIEDIALYNEFSGNHLPIVYIQKSIIGALKPKQTSYYWRYDWGDTYFIQSDFPLEFGSKVLIKPVHTARTKLLAQI